MALRMTLDKFLDDKKNKPLHELLSEKKEALLRLKNGKVVNVDQWTKLFPSDPKCVSTANFDISLMITLFRHVCLLTPPETGWNVLPPKEDASEVANIVRLKCFRNEIIHRGRTSIDNKEFKKTWKKVKKVLLALFCGPYEAKIDKLKTDFIDPKAAKYYTKQLAELKNMPADLESIGMENLNEGQYNFSLDNFIEYRE